LNCLDPNILIAGRFCCWKNYKTVLSIDIKQFGQCIKESLSGRENFWMTKIMKKNNMPAVKSSMLLREEFDDWAILFYPDTGNCLGLNPVSVFIWKHLDGNHTSEDILNALQENFEDVPEGTRQHVIDFVQELLARGYVGYDV